MDGIEPYVRGKNDHARGLKLVENPYEDEKHGTTEWESWYEGWDQADADRLSDLAPITPSSDLTLSQPSSPSPDTSD